MGLIFSAGPAASLCDYSDDKATKKSFHVIISFFQRFFSAAAFHYEFQILCCTRYPIARRHKPKTYNQPKDHLRRSAKTKGTKNSKEMGTPVRMARPN